MKECQGSKSISSQITYYQFKEPFWYTSWFVLIFYLPAIEKQKTNIGWLKVIQTTRLVKWVDRNARPPQKKFKNKWFALNIRWSDVKTFIHIDAYFSFSSHSSNENLTFFFSKERNVIWWKFIIRLFFSFFFLSFLSIHFNQTLVRLKADGVALYL